MQRRNIVYHILLGVFERNIHLGPSFLWLFVQQVLLSLLKTPSLYQNTFDTAMPNFYGKQLVVQASSLMDL